MKVKTYELKIGYAQEFVNDRKDHVIYREFIEAKSLTAAKLYATTKMKSMQDMKKFVTDRYGRKINWCVWCEPTEHKGNMYVNKKSKPLLSDANSIGFVQLSWNDLQLQLF